MKTPLAIVNKNPLNIRFSPMNDWRGQIGSKKGFCIFDLFYNGCRAALVLLSNYQRKGYDTVDKIISRWAPASENNTKAYISAVTQRLSAMWYDHPDGSSLLAVSRHRFTTYDELADLAYAMAFVEIGSWSKYHLDDMDDLRITFELVINQEKLPLLRK